MPYTRSIEQIANVLDKVVSTLQGAIFSSVVTPWGEGGSAVIRAGLPSSRRAKASHKRSHMAEPQYKMLELPTGCALQIRRTWGMIEN